MQIELNNEEIALLKVILNEKDTEIETNMFISGIYTEILNTNIKIIRNINVKLNKLGYEKTCGY